MIVTKKWLNDFVEISDISAKELADAFTFSGFEIESYKDLSEKLNHVVVGKIVSIEKHPNADKLLICQISDGTNMHQIITHATNMKEGDLVPVALEGADLANGVKIKPTNMRGIDSCGMMCAGEELGIDNSVYEGAETDGIMIIKPEDASVGDSIASVLGMDDVWYDVNVLANRPDCQSVVGLARELACALNRPFKMPNMKYKQETQEVDFDIDVQTENCPFLACQVVKDIKLGPSPKWMQKRLRTVGINTINNIVDITNYCMWEMGQPLHAYDLNQIEGNKLVVRNAKDKEKLTILGETELTLNPNCTVIANVNEAIGLAGIKGGQDFSVSSSTKDIVLESATFKKENIRKTGRGFGLRTDASSRYEKGVEPCSCIYGLDRALSLIDQLGVGKIIEKRYTSNNVDLNKKELIVDYDRILSWLGVDIPKEKALNILTKLDIDAKFDENRLICKVPPIRQDIQNFSDIAEEIIRYYGFETMPFKENEQTVSICGGYEKNIEENINAKDIMLSTGASEIKTYSFINPEDVKKLNLSETSAYVTKQVKIRNPLYSYMSVMRTQMLTSLLGAVKYNLNHKNADFSLFEVGKTFFNIDENTIPNENDILSFITIEKDADFFLVKSFVEMVAQKLGLTFSYSVDAKDSLRCCLHPNISANILWANKVVGVIGKVHPKILKAFDINVDTYYFELNLNNFPLKKVKKVKELSKFPTSTRDLAFIVDENTPVITILDQVKKAAGNYCENVEFFDVYQGEQLKVNEKSVAIRLIFRKPDGTLTQDEVNAQVDNVLKIMKEKLNARLREQ